MELYVSSTLFIRSFVRSFGLFIRSFVYWFIGVLVPFLICSFVYFVCCLFIHTFMGCFLNCSYLAIFLFGLTIYLSIRPSAHSCRAFLFICLLQLVRTCTFIYFLSNHSFALPFTYLFVSNTFTYSFACMSEINKKIAH